MNIAVVGCGYVAESYARTLANYPDLKLVGAFDRDRLLAAFDEIGRAAAGAGTRLEIAVYGGSALILASNFRYTSNRGSRALFSDKRCRGGEATISSCAYESRWSR